MKKNVFKELLKLGSKIFSILNTNEKCILDSHFSCLVRRLWR